MWEAPQCSDYRGTKAAPTFSCARPPVGLVPISCGGQPLLVIPSEAKRSRGISYCFPKRNALLTVRDVSTALRFARHDNKGSVRFLCAFRHRGAKAAPTFFCVRCVLMWFRFCVAGNLSLSFRAKRSVVEESLTVFRQDRPGNSKRCLDCALLRST
jgi:hypothetical protein